MRGSFIPLAKALRSIERMAWYGWNSGKMMVLARQKENGVGEWVRLCGVAEVPRANEVMEAEAVSRGGKGVPICLANVDGTLSAIGNVCPHRQGPLGGGWIEEGKVLCPWHAWAFDVTTGMADAPETGRVEVYPVKVEGGDVLVQIEAAE